ncbi:MAG: hypothetical protein ACLFTQ_00655 [Candidatus Aenigmatarchaeota archaeon]
MVDALIAMAIASLLAPVLAKYAGIMEEAKRGFSLIAGAGVLYLLARSFEVTEIMTAEAPNVAAWGTKIFGLIGWIFLLVGAILVAYKLAIE